MATVAYLRVRPAGAPAVRPAAADIAIVNGRVFTGVPSAPWAEALRVQGERITEVGTTAEVRAKAQASTQIIDAGGRLVIPGINDAHTHPGATPPHTQVEGPPAFTEDPGWDVVLQRVKAAVAKAPDGGWIVGEIGGAVLENPAATRFALDPITGDHPVMLASWHGHGTIFNTAALRRLGVSGTEPDPPGGMFARSPDGKTLTGLAQEYADFGLHQRFSLLTSADEQVRQYQAYAAEAVSFGITSVQAMATAPAAGVAAVVAKADLPIRFRLIDFPLVSPAEWPGAIRGPESPRLTISGAKYIIDGTPIERLMFLRAPYSDAPNSRGRLNFSETQLGSFLVRAMSARVQPMFHAVGDAAIDTVLAALERIDQTPRETTPLWPALRPRIEHGDMFEPAHFERAKQLGAVIVQNPAHFMLGPTLKARLGDRVNRTAMVKSIVRSGVPFALGSDGPMNPFLNIMFATINEVNPHEALTIEEALTAYTRGSAFAEFAEQRKGTLAPGMLADVAILSQDIFRIPPAELPKTTSVLTIVGGAVVHNKM